MEGDKVDCSASISFYPPPFLVPPHSLPLRLEFSPLLLELTKVLPGTT